MSVRHLTLIKLASSFGFLSFPLACSCTLYVLLSRVTYRFNKVYHNIYSYLSFYFPCMLYLRLLRYKLFIVFYIKIFVFWEDILITVVNSYVLSSAMLLQYCMPHYFLYNFWQSLYIMVLILLHSLSKYIFILF